MTAGIFQFPAASPLRLAAAGCMHACWLTYGDEPVNIEAVSRLHRHLIVHSPGRRNAARLARQLQAATDWLLEAQQAAVIEASSDGETTGEAADIAASRAIDLVGALGLLAMCRDALRPRFAAMTTEEISGAWKGLRLDVG